MKRKLILLKCLLLVSFAQAQPQVILDSLLQNASYLDAFAYFEKNMHLNPPSDSLTTYQTLSNIEFIILCDKLDAAETLINECEIAAKKYTNTSFLEGMCLIQRGKVAIKKLNFSVALLFFQRTEPFVKPHLKTHLDVLLYQSVALLGTGELEKSREMLDNMYNLAKGSSYAEKVNGLILHQKGTLALVEGNLLEAEKYFLQSVEFWGKINEKDNSQYFTSNFKLGMVYFLTGRYEKAKSILEALIQVYEKKFGKNHELYIQCYAILGRINIFLDANTDAEKTLKQSLEMMEQSIGKRHPDYVVLLGSLANFYKKEKRFEESKRCYLECKDILEKTNSTQSTNYYITLCNLAIVYVHTEQFDKAKLLFEIILSDGEAILGKNSSPYITAQYTYALMLCEQRQFEQSFYHFKNANKVQKIFLSNYFNHLSEEERIDYYQLFENNFESFNMLAMLNPQPAILQELMELRLYSKGLLLNENQRIIKSILNTDNQAIKENYQTFSNLKKQLAKNYALSPNQLAAANINIAALEEKTKALEENLIQASQAFSDWKNTQQESVNTVFENLKEEEAAIEIVRFRENKHDDFTDKIFYNYLIVRKKENQLTFKLLTQKNGKTLENAQYENYFLEATNRKSTISLMSELGSIFWKNMENELVGVNKIYISLDGIYNKINLETLKDEKEQYLGEKHEFVILTNLKEIIETTNEVLPPSPNAILIGNPAYDLNNLKQYDLPESWVNNETRSFELKPNPFTQKEVSAIHKILSKNNWESNLYVKKEASEEVLKNLKKSPTVLHIASHGYYIENINDKSNFVLAQSKNPLLRSMLFLSGAQNSLQNNKMGDEDGIFTAYEMANMDLSQTQLVVLSACQTGLGKIKNGEGVYGLQRAVKSAGAKSLIISLWEVDDLATQELMKNFYSNWIAGDSKHLAFKKAQLSVKQKFPQPFYWGGFVLVGK